MFFLNRPGECSMTSGELHPFRWCDIQIYMRQLQLDVFGAKASQLRAADWSGMTFTVQNSGVPGEIVRHARSGALHDCPVVGLAELCLLLRKNGSPHDAPLGTYREIPSGPLCYIKSSNIAKALKSASRVHGEYHSCVATSRAPPNPRQGTHGGRRCARVPQFRPVPRSSAQ